MWQAHSILWHYLWVAPNVLLLILVCGLWRRGLDKRYRFFFAFAIASAIEQLVVYACDLSPRVSPIVWWRIFWAGLIVEGILKFALIGEIFSQAFGRYEALAKLGKRAIGGVGVVLIFSSAIAAAFAPSDSRFAIIAGAHLLEQTMYIIEFGVLTAIFGFSAYFRVRMDASDRGIAIGLAVSACVHLGAWAVTANGGLPDDKRAVLDFVKMGAYHFCVLIWFYALLFPRRVSVGGIGPALPENNLDVWNRELERLLQQ